MELQSGQVAQCPWKASEDKAVIGGCFRCGAIFMLGEKYTAQAAQWLTTVLLLEALEDPGLDSLSGWWCLTEKTVSPAVTPLRTYCLF